MTAQSNLIALNSVLNKAIELGSTATYETFKEAVFADAAMKSSITAVAQGPKRNIYLVPADIGMAFAERFAAKHPKKQPKPVPEQLQLELPTDDLPTSVDEMHSQINALMQEVRSLRADMALLQGMALGMNHKIDKLTSVWECMEDDQK